MRAPIVLVVSWLVLDQLFTVLADHQGLLAPFGPVHVAPAILGLVVIALRLAVTFLVLPWAAWRVSARTTPSPSRAPSPPPRVRSTSGTA